MDRSDKGMSDVGGGRPRSSPTCETTCAAGVETEHTCEVSCQGNLWRYCWWRLLRLSREMFMWIRVTGYGTDRLWGLAERMADCGADGKERLAGPRTGCVVLLCRVCRALCCLVVSLSGMWSGNHTLVG